MDRVRATVGPRGEHAAHGNSAVIWAQRYARVALAAAFLSGIASRFGLYGRDVGYGNFAGFLRYTAEVNSFMPAGTIPFLAWAATAAELAFGLLFSRAGGPGSWPSSARGCWRCSPSR